MSYVLDSGLHSGADDIVIDGETVSGYTIGTAQKGDITSGAHESRKGTVRLTLDATAPAAGTLDVHLETSHDNSTWVNVGTAFTQVTTSNSVQRKVVSGCDRYVRAVTEVAALALSAVAAAGTTPPTVTVAETTSGSVSLATGTGSYRIEITTGGARGVAVFRWSDDGGETYTSAVTTAATVALSNGITATFATGTDYATDNVYTFDIADGYTYTLRGELV